MSTIELQAKLSLGPLALDLALRSDAATIVIDGPSGAGKSTCVRILAGLEPRARGRVVVGGDVYMDTEADVHVAPWARRVGWVPQEALLFPHRTVRENLSYAGGAGDALREVAETLRVATLLDRLPRNLSGGERQRVALGRAILSRPRLLLLDEPFSALDAPLREEIAGALAARCARESLPVVLVTHDTDAAAPFEGERWTLSNGALVRA
jgi:molybdate transport system ATP-binding protein